MINIGLPDLLVPNRRTADNRVPPGIAGAFALIQRMAARLKNSISRLPSRDSASGVNRPGSMAHLTRNKFNRIEHA